MFRKIVIEITVAIDNPHLRNPEVIEGATEAIVEDIRKRHGNKMVDIGGEAFKPIDIGETIEYKYQITKL